MVLRIVQIMMHWCLALIVDWFVDGKGRSLGCAFVVNKTKERGQTNEKLAQTTTDSD